MRIVCKGERTRRCVRIRVRQACCNDTHHLQLAASAMPALLHIAVLSGCTAGWRGKNPVKTRTPFYSNWASSGASDRSLAFRGNCTLLVVPSGHAHQPGSHSQFRRVCAASFFKAVTESSKTEVTAREFAQSDLLPYLLLGATSLQSVFGTSFRCSSDKLDAQPDPARFNEHRRQAACCVQEIGRASTRHSRPQRDHQGVIHMHGSS